jgi:hypothetical protein
MFARSALAALSMLAAWAVQPASAPPHAEAVAALQPIAYRPLEFAWTVGSDPVRVRSESWFAGAVSSIRFREVEFINADDHGRLLQGAISFGGLGECLNPTQAGASRDRRGRTTSQLLWAGTDGGAYATATRMAFWRRPGEWCRPHEKPGRYAENTTAASDVVYAQRFTPGYRGHANAVEAQITFTTASEQPEATVEALTAYTPPSFDTFHVFRGGRLVRDDTVARSPGEQPDPVVLSIRDGSSALGFLSLTQQPAPGYGRFRFENTNKINLVYRPAGPYRAGRHVYRMVWIIGTRAEVETTLRALAAPPGGRGGWASTRAQ